MKVSSRPFCVDVADDLMFRLAVEVATTVSAENWGHKLVCRCIRCPTVMLHTDLAAHLDSVIP